MKSAFLVAALVLAACGASAQNCDTWSPTRGCIGGNRSSNQTWSPSQGYAPSQQPAAPAPRTGPGQFVNCDQAGCWGSNNGVRYNFVAGGNLAGTDGSFCARGAGNTFSCN